MELTLLGKIKKWIVGMHLERLFQNRDENDNILLTDSAQKGVELAQKVKEWINSAGAAAFTSIIPGEWDNNIIQQMNLALPIIIQDLLKVTTFGDVGELLKQYKFSDDFHRDKFYHDLAKTAAYVLSDGKLTFTELTIVIELVYQNVFKK